MIALALACFLAGLTVGLLISSGGAHAERRHTAVTQVPGTPRRKGNVYGQAVDGVQDYPRTARQSGPLEQPKPFRLRRSFKERRAEWEAAHNTKAQRDLSLAQQIRKAQEGTLT